MSRGVQFAFGRQPKPNTHPPPPRMPSHPVPPSASVALPSSGHAGRHGIAPRIRSRAFATKSEKVVSATSWRSVKSVCPR